MSFLKKIAEKRHSYKSNGSQDSFDELNESHTSRASPDNHDRKMSSFGKSLTGKFSVSGMSLLDPKKDTLQNFLNYTLEESIPQFEPKKLSSLQRAVFDNDLKKIAKLLGEKDRNIDKSDSEHGVTSFFLAICLNYKEALLMILDSSKKVNVNSSNTSLGRTPLMMAKEFYSKLIKRLLLTKI